MTGDGNGDVLARNSDGKLILYPGNGTSGLNAPRQIGTGWTGYAITDAADMNAAGRPDILARDAAGILWLYPMSGNALFGARVQIGTGWNIMASIMGPGDVSGDGRPDVLARDSAGVLWVYTGNGVGGLTGLRTQAGTGWQVMTALVTPGNWDRAAGNDLISRDAAGRLWSYAGDKLSQFGPGLQIGTGWNIMNYIG